MWMTFAPSDLTTNRIFANMPAMDENENEVDYKRQALIASPRLMSEMPVIVCGLGTVGSNAAYHLARLGTKTFTLYDDDKVEKHNLPSQQFERADIGRYKVEAAKDQIHRVTNGATVDAFTERLEGGEPMEGIVVLGFDNMESRRMVFDLCCHMQPQVHRVIDIRMAGNTAQAFTLNPCNPDEVAAYRLFDFDDSEAAELPCGGESVSYVGPWSGVLAANLTRQHVMGEEVPFSVIMDFADWTFKMPKLPKVAVA
jgi:molybdopterin/thiamine biosynthesis adenylyltransferase